MWRETRGLAGAAGVLAAVLLTAACQATGHAGTTAAGGQSSRSSAAKASVRPATAPPSYGTVVALGDSYTAGGLLPVDAGARPTGCLRSTGAYPALVAQALHGQLTSAACVGAGVTMLTGPQQTKAGTNPAQLGVLKASDKLVLLTLGGDDLGFNNVLQECMRLATVPLGSPCQAHFAAPSGTGSPAGDQLTSRITAEGPKLALALAEIRQRAPRARVVLVGYPDMFPQSGGCWPKVPFTNGDVAYLRGIEVKIDAMQAAAARAAGDTFVDVYRATLRHDFCQPESGRDVEGLVPGSLTLPFHPNARGQQAMAAAVLQALKS